MRNPPPGQTPNRDRKVSPTEMHQDQEGSPTERIELLQRRWLSAFKCLRDDRSQFPCVVNFEWRCPHSVPAGWRFMIDNAFVAD